jgi:hypothetical protein
LPETEPKCEIEKDMPDMHLLRGFACPYPPTKSGSEMLNREAGYHRPEA